MLAEQLTRESRVQSVVLLGSLARDEASAAAVDGRLELFSDIELLAVTDGRLSGAVRSKLTAELEATANAFGYRNRLFHVDILFREHARLSKLPPFVFTFELVANGRLVAGVPCLQDVTEVSLRNLDLKNTREILMKRLWALAEALPPEWVRGAPLLPIDQRALGVALHRQPLDVPTALLPLSGVLLPTYRERVKYWSDHPELPVRRALDHSVGDSSAYLGHCLAVRADARTPADPHRSHREALAFLDAALAHLVGVKPGEGVGEAIAERSSRLFNERPLVRGEWLGLARHATSLARRRGPSDAIRCALAPRKGLLVAALLELHFGLALGLGGDVDTARRHLESARGFIAPVAEAGVGGASSGSFADDWLATRATIGRVFWRTVRLGDAAAWRRMEVALGLTRGEAP